VRYLEKGRETSERPIVRRSRARVGGKKARNSGKARWGGRKKARSVVRRGTPWRATFYRRREEGFEKRASIPRGNADAGRREKSYSSTRWRDHGGRSQARKEHLSEMDVVLVRIERRAIQKEKMAGTGFRRRRVGKWESIDGEGCAKRSKTRHGKPRASISLQ